LLKATNFDKAIHDFYDYKEGKDWHYPCGSPENMTPIAVECDFECEFTPSIRSDGLLFEFFNYESNALCTKFEAFYIGS